MPEPEHPNAADDALADMPALLAANAAALAYLRGHRDSLMFSYCTRNTDGTFDRSTADTIGDAHLAQVEALIARLALQPMPPPPAFDWPVNGILDMNTAHVCTEGRDLIEKWVAMDTAYWASNGRGELAPAAAFRGADGWIIGVATQLEVLFERGLRTAEVPKSIRDCWEFARKRNCSFIRFDVDGEEHDGLPSYDW